MEWTPEWESLADALQRVARGGMPQDVAKQRICTDIAQDQILIRPYVASEIAGKPHIRLGEKRLYRKPPLLEPGDFDWKNSRPVRRWPINRTTSDYGWEDADITFLELKAADVTDRLCRVLNTATAAKIGEPSDTSTSAASDRNNVVLAQSPQLRPSARRGALSKYDWEGARVEFFRLMEYHGPFLTSDGDWNCQARAEREIIKWFSNRGSSCPVESTVRSHISEWLIEYTARIQKADKG
jgi:hypothetical protein